MLTVQNVANIMKLVNQSVPRTVQEVWARAIERSKKESAAMTEAEKDAMMTRNVQQMRISRGLDKKARPKLAI